MADKKKSFIHEISAEELLKVVSSSKEEIDVGKLTDSAKFIYNFNIKAGDTKVLAALIYHTYKEWVGEDNAQPKWKFFRDFSKYFDRTHIRSQTYYFLNPKPFDLSKETWWEIRRNIRKTRERNRQKKQEKQKRSSQVPSTKEEV